MGELQRTPCEARNDGHCGACSVRPSPYVFVTERGRHMTEAHFRKLLSRAGREASFPFLVYSPAVTAFCRLFSIIRRTVTSAVSVSERLSLTSGIAADVVVVLCRAVGGETASCAYPLLMSTPSSFPIGLPPHFATDFCNSCALKRIGNSQALVRHQAPQCPPGGRARRFPWRRLALALTRRDARPRRSRRHVMPTPLRMALEQLPALASRGPLARW